MRKINAFTLLELCFVLLITSCLGVLAIGYLQKKPPQELAHTRAHHIAHHLHFAKIEAIKRLKPIHVCGTTDFTSCSPLWSEGFMIYVDQNQDGRFSENDLILRTVRFKPSCLKIYSGNTAAVKFSPTGRCLTRCTLSIRFKETLQAAIILYDSGRARLEYY